ncbi:MAG: ACT domain-containing protein, partial [Acidimicrobiales bacterium]
ASRRARTGRARGAPEVRIDLEASSSATVVEIWASDEVGLLHRVSGAIAGLGLDIRHAKGQTLGHEVVDTFYLLDSGGEKVTDPEVLAELRVALVAAAAGPGVDLGAAGGKVPA